MAVGTVLERLMASGSWGWQKERMIMLALPKVPTMVRLLMVPHTGKAG